MNIFYFPPPVDQECLMLIIKGEEDKAIKMFKDGKCQPWLRNIIGGCAPLRTSSLYNRKKVLKYVLPYSKLDILYNQAIRLAAGNDNIEVVDILLSFPECRTHKHLDRFWNILPRGGLKKKYNNWFTIKKIIDTRYNIVLKNSIDTLHFALKFEAWLRFKFKSNISLMSYILALAFGNEVIIDRNKHLKVNFRRCEQLFYDILIKRKDTINTYNLRKRCKR